MVFTGLFNQSVGISTFTILPVVDVQGIGVGVWVGCGVAVFVGNAVAVGSGEGVSVAGTGDTMPAAGVPQLTRKMQVNRLKRMNAVRRIGGSGVLLGLRFA